MPSIFKNFSLGRAKPYEFPDAEKLMPRVETEEAETSPALEEAEPAEEGQTEPPAPEKEPNPVSYAQIQADSIAQEARRQAEEILEQARQEARRQAEEIHAAAREEGYQEGYVQGGAKAMEEAARLQEEQADRQAAAMQEFLDRAGGALDRQMDESINELRDLALTIAEKVVSISLKSSAEVISRMIQTAVDKRKRREWVHIYIAECDAKRLVQVPATLTAALSALSDRVRIIPMADDESGTCIIEMPDEIVDASAATQLSNIRSLLMDTPSGTSGGNLF
ncbi:F0F1 ATP synthase subunit delta [Pseudoflavonifractor sp. 524-17]|uniref:FliH/SctL family protein n=1 Tax=Pseudoflavonifractor sp. 524-17 TaxID=2304577 RepID=UPI00137B57BC|nr:FliH/SctL family protein [Pseudoflavonifractor sp. 524-17]NCE66041.1 F0F1 ATP synthase subunit delta [Pseudoflavonifractor sp. 524-17]